MSRSRSQPAARFTATILLGTVMMGILAVATSAGPKVSVRADALVLANGQRSLDVSLKSPEFTLGDKSVGGELPSSALKGDILSGKRLELPYPPIRLQDGGALDVRVSLRWSARESVLRKWASYRLSDTSAQPLLKEVVLDRLALGNAKVEFHPFATASHPAFWSGFFAGIEYPAAASTVQNGVFTLAHRPGLRLKSGVWYETRKAVYGVSSVGNERQSFVRYIELNRPSPKGLHINYEPWWSLPVPFTEADAVNLIKTFDDKLYKPHGEHFDTFCITLGWGDLKSIWNIDKKLLPEGFKNIRAASERMHAKLGLWFSPSSYYSSALDNDWAGEHGYETLPSESPYQKHLLCVAGTRYRTALKDRLIELVSRYDITQLKIDGLALECPESNHGHEPGPLSSEAVAESVVFVLEAVRRVNPRIWTQSTCFGPNPSPWWAFHSNSVTGFYGTDAPYGVVPCPVYRESYTTARDRFNLQGAAVLTFPIAAQDLMGIVHQTREPFMNDAVVCVLRGNLFVQPYVNPLYMDDAGWKRLARLINWTRRNASVLEETQPLQPASWEKSGIRDISYWKPMPRESYGYAHWGRNGGLVALRNPWIAPCKRLLKLDQSAGFSKNAKGLSVVSLYPEIRVYAKGLRFGDGVEVPLAPYETVVLSVGSGQRLQRLPDASSAIGGRLKLDIGGIELRRVHGDVPGRAPRTTVQSVERPEGEVKPNVPTDTTAAQRSASHVELRLAADVTVTAPNARVLILMEGKKAAPANPVCKITVNGKDVAVGTRYTIDTYRMPGDPIEAGWGASCLPTLENWRFMLAPLGKGPNHVSVELLTGDDTWRVSAWVWATKPGGGFPSYPNALPCPETVSLDAAELMAPVEIDRLPLGSGP